MQLKWSKYQKSKDENMRWTGHKYVFGNDSLSNNYGYIKNVFPPLTSTSLFPYSSTSGIPTGSHQNIQKEIEYIYAILEPPLWAL